MPGAVLIVDGHREWPPELLATIAGQGHTIVRIDDIRLVPFFVLAGGVQAVMVDARGLEVVSMLALQQCRRVAPATSVVVVVGRSRPPRRSSAPSTAAPPRTCRGRRRRRWWPRRYTARRPHDAIFA
jgi:hypothetical protein